MVLEKIFGGGETYVTIRQARAPGGVAGGRTGSISSRFGAVPGRCCIPGAGLLVRFAVLKDAKMVLIRALCHFLARENGL